MLGWKTRIAAIAQNANELGNTGHAGGGDDLELSHIGTHRIRSLASLAHE